MGLTWPLLVTGYLRIEMLLSFKKGGVGGPVWCFQSFKPLILFAVSSPPFPSSFFAASNVLIYLNWTASFGLAGLASVNEREDDRIHGSACRNVLNLTLNCMQRDGSSVPVPRLSSFVNNPYPPPLLRPPFRC